MELQPIELLKIIKGYALQGGSDESILSLLEHLSPHTPLIKEKEKDLKTNNIYKEILKIVSGERDLARNVAQDLRDYIDSTDGTFTLNECYNALGINNTKEKAIVRKTLSVSCTKKDIEKIGTKAGNYRRIDKTIEFTDIATLKGLGDPIKFKTPLDVGDRTIFFPRSLWGIAGVTGNGKTTFAFNIIREIQYSYETVYFYEAELGPDALRHKLGYFQCPLDSWNFKAICSSNSKGVIQWDSSNIHQKVFPDAINIIDYLEPPEDYPWKIYHVMKAIAAALNRGMAIILIQKKEGSKYGIGGDWSAKATSFYTSLEWGVLKIEKNSYQQEDRIGRAFKCRDFEIAAGSHIKEKSGWYSEESKRQQEKIKKYADMGVTDDEFTHED
jgi:hypothetical protein